MYGACKITYIATFKMPLGECMQICRCGVGVVQGQRSYMHGNQVLQVKQALVLLIAKWLQHLLLIAIDCDSTCAENVQKPSLFY